MSEWAPETGELHHGSCLCGAVRYSINGMLRQVAACHCTECLRFHGNFAAYTAAPREAVVIEDQQNCLAWFDAKRGVRRGFCRRCGSSLFWDRIDRPVLSISAGSLEQPTGLSIYAHIHVASKSDYYVLCDGVEQYSEGLPDAGV